MEFHEKLQQLRKQQELTQEQLAERLFVSRTAVSKWESGRGYPNLESLKDISRLFGVSIDELLSNDELIELAETEKRSDIRREHSLVFGALDLVLLALLFLPLFGRQEGAYIRAVSLLECTDLAAGMRRVYLALLTALPLFGALEIAVELRGGEKGSQLCKFGSVALHAGAILLFSLSRQPYATAFLFLLFVVKMMLILRQNSIK